jgi:predicted O-methyltransferase YrrM
MLSQLKRIIPNRILNFLVKMRISLRYMNRDYRHAMYWARKNTEFSNYYYDITDLNRKNIAGSIALIFGVPIAEVLGYVTEIEENQTLKNAISRFKKDNPNYSDSKIYPARRIAWYCVIRITKPELVVETGIHNGLGATVILLGLQKNGLGKYMGVDINPDAGRLIPKELLLLASLEVSNSIDFLNSLKNSSIDLLITDSDHRYDFEISELESSKNSLKSEAIIISDNSHDSSALFDYSMQKGRRFAFLQENTKNHWYAGAGIGISLK